MRILHTSDWHLGKRLGTFSRIDEQRRVLAEIVEIADQQSVDVVLVAGDLWDVFNPSSDAAALLYQTLKDLTNHGQRPVIAIAGNHDAPERVEAAEMLASECGIILSGFPDTEPVGMSLPEGTRITASAPGFLELNLKGYNYPLRLILTPYANEYRMRRFLGIDSTSGLREALQNRWNELAGTYCNQHGVNILVGHLFLTGAGEPRPEEPVDEARPIVTVGGAGEMFSWMVPPQIQYVAMGHLHRRIITSREPAPVVYPGSILQYSFSEAGQPKSVEIVDIEPAKPVSYSPVEITGISRLIRHKAGSPDEAVQWLSGIPAESFIELTVVVPDYLGAEQVNAIHSAHPGIVQIIPQNDGITESDEHHSLPDPGSGIKQLFSDYFRSRQGVDPNAAILDLFDEVIGYADGPAGPESEG